MKKLTGREKDTYGLSANKGYITVRAIHKKTTFELFSEKFFCSAIIDSSFDRCHNPNLAAVLKILFGNFGSDSVCISNALSNEDNCEEILQNILETHEIS